MGICHVLHELDPTAVDDVAARPPRTVTELRALLSRHGRDDPRSVEMETWDELAETAEQMLDVDRAWLARLAVLGAASRATWDLDKAPTHAFLELFQRAPSLAPVARLFVGEAWLPAGLAGEDEGLVNIARRDDVRDALAAIRPWIDDGARERIAALPARFTWLDKLLRRRDGHAREWRNDDDYAWDNWRRTGEALAACAAHRAWLGVTMG